MDSIMKELLEDVVDALANKRLLEKANKDPVGAQITSELIERVKAQLNGVNATQEK